MNAEPAQDHEFAALKDLARLKYLLDYEVIATAANDGDALTAGPSQAL
jgi:hypothetical protein